MIPEAAVEAARDVLYENDRSIDVEYATLEAALEAAAPHIIAAAKPTGLESTTVAYEDAHTELIRAIAHSKKSRLQDGGAMLVAAKIAYDVAYDALIAEVWK